SPGWLLVWRSRDAGNRAPSLGKRREDCLANDVGFARGPAPITPRTARWLNSAIGKDTRRRSGTGSQCSESRPCGRHHQESTGARACLRKSRAAELSSQLLPGKNTI